ncbi:hypothetical protein NLC29_00055 [Candidatus Aminicenantes bacterium AH-873-B07]|jgi:hypothetical protein|nr:hypothetical protein [Candidatus Aminicenantes bacterium AH-873-B07]
MIKTDLRESIEVALPIGHGIKIYQGISGWSFVSKLTIYHLKDIISLFRALARENFIELQINDSQIEEKN